MASRNEPTNSERQKIDSESLEVDKNCSFSIFPRVKFDKNFPFYRRPQEIGYFSLDIKRQIAHDKSQLRYYTVPQNVCFDLRLGFEKMIQKDEEQKEFIDHILKWILKHRHVFAIRSRSSSASAKPSDSKKEQTSKNS